MDVLGPLPKTKFGTQFIMTITNLCSNQRKANRTAQSTAIAVAKILVKHWISHLRIPSTIFTDSGSRFIAKLFQAICAVLRTTPLTTTDYSAQPSEQAERYDATTYSWYRHYVADNQRDRDRYVMTLTYAYNVQTHLPIRLTKFSLVLNLRASVSTSIITDTIQPEASKIYSPLAIQIRLFNCAALLQLLADKHLKFAERHDR